MVAELLKESEWWQLYQKEVSAGKVITEESECWQSYNRRK